MSGYVARRVGQLVPVLLIVSAVVFFVFRIVPGDMAVMRLGQNADPESITAMRKLLGLDRPLYVQYVEWLGNAARGDLGTSYINEQSVTSLVLQTFPATLELAVLGMLLALVLSVPVGILAALRRGTWLDHIARVMALIGFCMPRYWLAVLLISLLAVQVGWLPPAGYADLSTDPTDNLRHAALPVLSLGLTIAAVQMRFLRSSLLDVLGQDYVRTARAKGLLPRTVSLRHALKNALIPFVTVVGLEMGSLLGGLVVVEQIFSWPGIGWLMINSITQRDYAVVQGSVLLIAAGVVVINLVVDVLYGYLDPRIRYA
ncbi:MAG: ABC transporter permease [Chloroflexi bacterium]|nr:ABC transporter permease [Chloroflexota bacterium]